MDNQFLHGAIFSGIIAVVVMFLFAWFLDRKLQEKVESGEFFKAKGNVLYRFITARELSNLLAAERKRSQCVTLNGHQLYEALQIVMPDVGEPTQLETELTISYGLGAIDDHGTVGYGLFAYPTEYPEDGSYHLEDEPTLPQTAEYARLQAMPPTRNPMETLAVGAPVEGELVNADIEGAALIASTSLSARRKALQDASRVVRTELDPAGGDLADGGYTIEAIEGLLERRAKQIEGMAA